MRASTGLALGLLGREVRGGAEDGGGLGDRRGRVRHRAGDAEVHHLDLAGVGDHDVAGLDVAVDDAGAVRVLERCEHAVDVSHRVFDRLERAVGDDVLEEAPRRRIP